MGLRVLVCFNIYLRQKRQSESLNLIPLIRVFVNRSLHLEKIKFYGFDMDYTLAGKIFCLIELQQFPVRWWPPTMVEILSGYLSRRKEFQNNSVCIYTACSSVFCFWGLKKDGWVTIILEIGAVGTLENLLPVSPYNLFGIKKKVFLSTLRPWRDVGCCR